MTWLEMLAVFAAGLGAGTINTVVGSGTLITFPTLLAIGVPPVIANVSNTVGLLPGSVSAVVGYRRELAGQRGRLVRLGAASLLGGITGALLLLVLPPEVFDAIVPVLIGTGCVLVVLQPRIARWVAASAEARGGIPEHGARWVWVMVFSIGIYGGYFGAAQGVLLMASMGIGIQESLQRLNGTKNVLAGIVNLVASLVFIVAVEIDWTVAGLIAAGSVIGAQIGATVGRRLPAAALRTAIAVVGSWRWSRSTDEDCALLVAGAGGSHGLVRQDQ